MDAGHRDIGTSGHRLLVMPRPMRVDLPLAEPRFPQIAVSCPSLTPLTNFMMSFVMAAAMMKISAGLAIPIADASASLLQLLLHRVLLASSDLL